MGLEDIHNLKAIDKEIETKLLSIRGKLKQNTKLSQEDNHIAKVSYKAITGRKPNTGCQSCNNMIKILNNWFISYYDKQTKGETLTQVNETKQPNYFELLKMAKDKGFEIKGKPNKQQLIEYLNK